MPNPATATCERTEQGWRVVCECGKWVDFNRDFYVGEPFMVRMLLNHLSGLDGTHKGKERET